MSLSSQQNKTLLTGHEGAGSDCLGKAIDYGWKGLLIGGLRNAIKRYRRGYYVTVLCCGVYAVLLWSPQVVVLGQWRGASSTLCQGQPRQC